MKKMMRKLGSMIYFALLFHFTPVFALVSTEIKEQHQVIFKKSTSSVSCPTLLTQPSVTTLSFLVCKFGGLIEPLNSGQEYINLLFGPYGQTESALLLLKHVVFQKFTIEIIKMAKLKKRKVTTQKIENFYFLSGCFLFVW